MTITRELKRAVWQYTDETQELYIQTTDEHGIIRSLTLDRTYAFSLARFLIRVFFRMSMKKNMHFPLRGKKLEAFQDTAEEDSLENTD